MFIAFKGIDSSGKATQSKLLYDYLSKNSECILTQEPAYSTQTGSLIKEILNNNKEFDTMTLQLLFTADRAFHVKSVIAPALSEKKNVITSLVSGDAYSLTVRGESEALAKANVTAT